MRETAESRGVSLQLELWEESSQGFVGLVTTDWDLTRKTEDVETGEYL